MTVCFFSNCVHFLPMTQVVSLPVTSSWGGGGGGGGGRGTMKLFQPEACGLCTS